MAADLSPPTRHSLSVTIRGHPTRPAAVANLPVSSKRRFLLRSDDNLASHSIDKPRDFLLTEDLR